MMILYCEDCGWKAKTVGGLVNMLTSECPECGSPLVEIREIKRRYKKDIKKLYQEIYDEVKKEKSPNPKSFSNQKLALMQRVCDILGYGKETLLEWENGVAEGGEK